MSSYEVKETSLIVCMCSICKIIFFIISLYLTPYPSAWNLEDWESPITKKGI
uniref:Uncharacterized protein n=1 Tax=Arundo donax TaxID=35708 RepID=A0A0A9H3X9_ARUDO